LEHLL